ncbi:ArsR/SmtB family transcription factor [Haloferax namakaokahaiae]|uniref:ArsR/SmtB family transcription factor n=1 Tax=Haloferax namakaokahaiae TaxID=1748331 RepID=A0ABD5ZE59_9EURY
MSSLLPLKPVAESVNERTLDPHLVALDDAEADSLVSVLSSTTARRLLAAVYDTPRPASELAEELDTTLQTVGYHIDRLTEAGLIEEVTTWLSAQGREMAVYGPTSSALVLFVGAEETRPQLRSTLRTLVGGIGVAFLGSALVQGLWSIRAPKPVQTLARTQPEPFWSALVSGYIDGPGLLVLGVGVLFTVLATAGLAWTQKRV